jgi:hypothetical protein
MTQNPESVPQFSANPLHDEGLQILRELGTQLSDQELTEILVQSQHEISLAAHRVFERMK